MTARLSSTSSASRSTKPQRPSANGSPEAVTDLSGLQENFAEYAGTRRRTEQDAVSNRDPAEAFTNGLDIAGDRLRAIVRFTMDLKHTAELVKALRQIPEAESCYSVSGAFDLVVVVGAETAVRLHQVLKEFGEMRGVERTTSSIVLVTEFDHR